MVKAKAMSIFVVFILIVGCAKNTDRLHRARDDNGIIYLSEKQAKSLAKKEEASSGIKKDQSEQDDLQLRKFKKSSGITYLSFEDQANEIPGKPIQRNHFYEEGKASYYADRFHGRKTASGEIYDKNKLTAAHPTLKFGTKVRVTNLFNNKSVVVVINDRGPALKSRIIDLSYQAAKQLEMLEDGVIQVSVEVSGQY